MGIKKVILGSIIGFTLLGSAVKVSAATTTVQVDNGVSPSSAYEQATGYAAQINPITPSNIEIGNSVTLGISPRTWVDRSQWRVPDDVTMTESMDVGEAWLRMQLLDSPYGDSGTIENIISINRSTYSCSSYSSNPNIVSVDVNGNNSMNPSVKVVGKQAGSAVITTSVSSTYVVEFQYSVLQNNGTFASKSAKANFSINDNLFTTIRVNNPKLTITEQPEYITQDGYKYIVNSTFSDLSYTKDFEWYVEDTTVASLEVGHTASASYCNVTGLRNGSTTLYCRSTDGQLLQIPLEVRIVAKKMSVSCTKNKLTKIGETAECSVTFTPEAPYDTHVEWSSSNPAAVSVDANGKITAGSFPYNEDVYITAKCGDLIASKKITTAIEITDFVFTTKTSRIVKGGTTYEKCKVTPFNIQSGNIASGITFKSSNTSVAKIDAKTGKLKAVNYGTATITATFDKYTVSKTITVIPKTADIIKSKSSRTKKQINFALRTVKGVSGYQIQISSKKSFVHPSTKSISASKLSKSKNVWKIKQANKVVYVRFRTYVTTKGGKKVYSNWSSIWKVSKI